MKRMWFMMAVAMLLVLPGWALAADTGETAARVVVPEDARLLYIEADDLHPEYVFFSEADGAVYEVELNESGAVSQLEIKLVDGRGAASASIDEQAARAAVLSIYPEATVDFVVLDREDGLLEYKVAFSTDTWYGAAKVNPETGMVFERELFFLPDASARGGADSLSADDAKQLALGRVAGGELVDFEADTERGRLIYEGTIRDGRCEYEFEIDAATARFLEWDREALEPGESGAKSQQGQPTQAAELIGLERAKEIALNQAGGGTVKKIELDREDGVQVYEGEVILGQYKYEFEIDAKTGRVLDWDRDEIDDD